jgi:hypothetical protein
MQLPCVENEMSSLMILGTFRDAKFPKFLTMGKIQKIKLGTDKEANISYQQ